MLLSLDLLERSPFGHFMKFAQGSFPLYLLELSTFSKLVRFFFVYVSPFGHSKLFVRLVVFVEETFYRTISFSKAR